MKKIILIAGVCLAGCEVPEQKSSVKNLDEGCYEITVDGCQYIKSYYTSAVMVHKGNCHNHEHKSR